eukprot:5103298-Amphidinium_carterae.1
MSHAVGKPLSSKVPAVKKTGSPEKDLLLVQRSLVLIKTLDLLDEHPQHTVIVRDFLTQLISNDEHSFAVAQEEFFESISTLGKVDEDFLVNELERLYGEDWRSLNPQLQVGSMSEQQQYEFQVLRLQRDALLSENQARDSDLRRVIHEHSMQTTSL